MRYVLNPDTNVEKLVKELNELEGINARVEEVEFKDEYCLDTVSIVIKNRAVQLELERAIILLEEQNEIELAVQKLKDLKDLFQKIETGELDFE